VQKQIFGIVLAYMYVYTVEFQKRGLPDAHMLFILSRRQHCWQNVDHLVCAELPNPSVNQQLFAWSLRPWQRVFQGRPLLEELPKVIPSSDHYG